jgi:hypothetical protein
MEENFRSVNIGGADGIGEKGASDQTCDFP